MVARRTPEFPSKASSRELAWVPQCPLIYLRGPDGPYNPEASDGGKGGLAEDVRSRASAINQTAVYTKATTGARYPGIFSTKSPVFVVHCHCGRANRPGAFLGHGICSCQRDPVFCGPDELEFRVRIEIFAALTCLPRRKPAANSVGIASRTNTS